MRKLARKIPLVLLLLETSNKINRDRIQGILRYERLYGPWRLHLVEGRRFEQPVRDLRALGVKGILAGTTLTELLPPVMRTHVPVVFFDAQCPYQAQSNRFAKYSSVTCDNAAVGRFAAGFLLEKGFSHFAYVEDTWGSVWSREREEGFVRRLAETEASCSVYRVPSAKARADWGVDQRAMSAWLKGLPKPVGILAAHDARGRQVLDTCQFADIGVPDEVAVLGIDNDELICSATNPPMSSVLRDTERSGYLAAELLDRLMRGKAKARKKENLTYGSVSIVERLSTERLQFNDYLAVKAVEFIRINSGIGMSVSDVVKRLGVSRRLAEIRFRQATGCSIHGAIQEARLTQVCRLLRETDLPIGTISAQCGFVTDSYLGLVFRQRFKMSMREYRRAASP
jgi:LacI family transcriptional regulator